MMLNRIRGRVGSAHLIAVTALVLAVTGTAIALPGKNSVNGQDIKNGAVKSLDVRDNNLRGDDVKESTLDPVPSADQSNDVLWAVVTNPSGAGNAALARFGRKGTTVTESGGAVQVNFAHDVSNCAWVATKGLPGGGGTEPAGFAQVNGVNGQPTVVEVRTRDDTGANVDGNFHLVVTC
jgi:hypothetical protein